MLKRIATWRHGVVGAVIAVFAVLAAFQVIGGGNHSERFDAKQFTVSPAGEDGVRIREVVDQDFGTNDRHGYQRIIPTDFGEPTDVSASSPDAAADVYTSNEFEGFRIRIGDPDETVSGQHRYVLTYTLPDARLSSSTLALDIIGTDETSETKRFEVIVTGLELADPLCNVGVGGDSGGCTLERDGDVYRAVVSPLEPGQGITIGGQIAARTEATDLPMPPPIDRRDDNGFAIALIIAIGGLVVAAGVFLASSIAGRNEVFAGGAADAAFGSLPAPNAPTSGTATTAVPTRQVSDADLEKMATVEFAPPEGLQPWHGAVLLNECIDEATVSAWFSGLVAREVLELKPNGDDDLTIWQGPKISEHTPQEGAVIGAAFGMRDSVTLGTYDQRFATAWGQAKDQQAVEIEANGWWKRGTPRAGGGFEVGRMFAILLPLAFFLFIGSAAALFGAFRNPIVAVAGSLIAVALVAFGMYRALLPARSAAGSALALRTESFRRFLEASEGRHVDWAWERGVVREYSAWAVALGAADAWRHALDASDIPEPEMHVATAPLIVYSMGSSFHSTFTAPASSGSGGFSGGGFSGGFSGGSVGGGGGGGSSGSW